MNTLSQIRNGFAVLSLAASLSASAGFTTVEDPKFGDQSRESVFAALYGGSFAKVAGQYTNGSVTLSRVDDFNADKTDQIWDAGKYTIRSVARFTSAEARLQGSFENSPVLHIGQFGVDLTNSVKVNAPTSFFWTAKDYYGTSSTDTSANADGADHFITFKVQGTSAASKYVLFWEDLPQTSEIRKTNKTWHDFNDLIVEVQAVSTGGAVIPLPPAALAGGLTMGLLSVGSYLRKRFAK